MGAGGEEEKGKERERENKANCNLKELHIKIIGYLINCVLDFVFFCRFDDAESTFSGTFFYISFIGQKIYF